MTDLGREIAKRFKNATEAEATTKLQLLNCSENLRQDFFEELFLLCSVEIKL